MSHPFDATLKDLVEAHAADFAPIFGLAAGVPIMPLNVDLSTLTAATDIVLGIGDPLTEIVDFNFQSGPDPSLDRRILLYAAALHYRYVVPVRSLIILLRPLAGSPQITANVAFSCGGTRLQFSYEIMRLWEQPVDAFLHGGLGLLPLAPLCQMPPGVPIQDAVGLTVRAIDRRLQGEADRARAAELMTATFILTGARLDFSTAAAIFRGNTTMIESSTYQGLLDQGALRQARQWLLRKGRQRFGTPDPSTEGAINAIADLDRLERMTDAVQTTGSWQELLATA